MKLIITKGTNPVAELFAAPLSLEGETDLHRLQFAQALFALMQEQEISRGELARRMGVPPSRVTAILSGDGNFTLQTMVRAARAVNAKYHHCLAPASQSVHWKATEKAETL